MSESIIYNGMITLKRVEKDSVISIVLDSRVPHGSDSDRILAIRSGLVSDSIQTRKKLSRDPVIRSRRSFFCWIELVVLVPTKKKIAEIGPVDREIIAKNDFSTSDQFWITDRSVRNTSYRKV